MQAHGEVQRLRNTCMAMARMLELFSDCIDATQGGLQSVEADGACNTDVAIYGGLTHIVHRV